MRFSFFTGLVIIVQCCFAQGSAGISKVGQWQATDSLFIVYNEVWGFEANGTEYGVIGSYYGTHIISLADPSNPVEVAFVEGKYTYAIHRDFHDYKGYLYMVCDEGPSTLQIADLSYLPDSVHLVYDSNSIIERAHNIFIDSATVKLYTSDGKILSLADPENPTHEETIILDGGGHDMYVRNDTAYYNVITGIVGLYIYDCSNYPVTLINDFINYPDKGNNHSGWLNEKGDVYVFAEETQGVTLKIIDVYNPYNIKLLSTFKNDADALSIAHNPIIKGNQVFVSYYMDGLVVWNIADPENPYLMGYYDTYTALNEYQNVFGAWGVFPFLKSDLVLVSDMKNGLFILDVSEMNTVRENKSLAFDLFPNPVRTQLNIIIPSKGPFSYIIHDIYGRQIGNGKLTGSSIDVSQLYEGTYFLVFTDGEFSYTQYFQKY